MDKRDDSVYCFGNCKRRRVDVDSDEERIAEKQKIDISELLKDPVVKSLGLTLTITTSFIDAIEKTLSSEDSEAKKEDSMNSDTRRNSDIRRDAAASVEANVDVRVEADDRRASSFWITSLTIGSWQSIAKNNGDLVGKIYFRQKKLVWEILDQISRLKKRILMDLSNIVALRADFSQELTSTLEIMLSRAPQFYEERTPIPGKHTSWQDITDFTDGQASNDWRHFVKLPSEFQKHYMRLLHYDERLRNLSTKPFPSWPSIIAPTWPGGFRGPLTSNIRTFEAQSRAGGHLTTYPSGEAQATYGRSRAHIQTSRLPTTYPVGEAHAARGGSEGHIETSGLPKTSVIGERHAACCGNSGHSIDTYYAQGGSGGRGVYIRTSRPPMTSLAGEAYVAFGRNMAHSSHVYHADAAYGGREAYNRTSEPLTTSLPGEDDATCGGSSYFPGGGNTSYDNTAHTSHARATHQANDGEVSTKNENNFMPNHHGIEEGNMQDLDDQNPLITNAEVCFDRSLVTTSSQDDDFASFLNLLDIFDLNCLWSP
ncbi:hypothetical protein AMTRI_Chr02g221120 [Amborella trichopoda]